MDSPRNGILKINHSELSATEWTLLRIYELLFAVNICFIYLFANVKLIVTFVELLMGFDMVLLLLFRRQKNIVIPYNTIWYGIYTIFCALSAIWSQYFYRETTDNIFRMVVITVMITSLAKYVNDEYDIERLVDLFVFSVFVIVIIELSSTPVSLWTNGHLGSNVAQNNLNNVSFWTACAGMMSFYKAYIRNKKTMYLLFLIFFIFSLLSGSRKTIIVLLIAPIIIILFATYKKFLALNSRPHNRNNT